MALLSFLKRSSKVTPVITTNQQKVLDRLSHLIPNYESLSSEQISEAANKVLSLQAMAQKYADRMRNIDTKDYVVAAALAAIYTKTSQHYRAAIKEIDKYRFHYIVDMLISQMAEDALTPDTSTGEIVEITSAKPDIQRELKELDERVRFDDLVAEITPDLIAYGEYTLSTSVVSVASGKESTDPKLEESEDVGKPNTVLNEKQTTVKKEEAGLTELRDDVPLGSVIAMSSGIDTDFYLTYNEGEKDRNSLFAIHPVFNFVKFKLGASKVRIDMFNDFDAALGVSTSYKDMKQKLQKIPRFIRVGKSAILPILSKVKELELLELLVPATKLSKLSSGSVVGLRVPSTYDTSKALLACEKVEDVINKKKGIDPSTGDIALADVMTGAGRIKVVPVFGEKGDLQKMDYKSDEPDDLLGSVDDLRKTITTYIGFPFELFFESDSDSKSEILKKYARYLRKLKAIQKAIVSGIRQICYIHLVNKGYDVLPRDIEINFRNKLIEIDNLDRLEFLDTTLGYLETLKGFIFGLAEESSPFKDLINLEEFAKILKSHLETIGLSAVLDLRKLKQIGTESPLEPDQTITN